MAEEKNAVQLILAELDKLSSADALLLLCGEMSRQEIRTVKAVLDHFRRKVECVKETS